MPQDWNYGTDRLGGASMAQVRVGGVLSAIACFRQSSWNLLEIRRRVLAVTLGIVVMTSAQLVLSPLSWTTGDLWRWLMLLFGLLSIGRGLFSKNVRMRDSSTWEGWWRGKIATKRWQVFYMRSLLVVIGLAFIVFAFTFQSSR